MRPLEHGAVPASYTALLMPNGRFGSDFFVCNSQEEQEGSLLLDVDRSDAGRLQRALKMYALRRRVTVDDVSQEMRVWSLMSVDQEGMQRCTAAARQRGDVSFVDPRLAKLGARMLLSQQAIPKVPQVFQQVGEDFYEALRVTQGVPTGGADLIRDKSMPLEAGLDWLNGIAFHKGCYVGQELTQRVHTQGVVRKRFMPVRLVRADKVDTHGNESVPNFEALPCADSALFPNTLEPQDLLPADSAHSVLDVTLKGKKVGTLHSAIYNFAIARLRLRDALSQKRTEHLRVSLGDQEFVLVPQVPQWWLAHESGY
ncbi:MAG: hypothetical protein MHM6MM_007801 [Cercozoa sp. M6MM]